MNPHKATFGTGCFWCTEALFKKVKGVTSVTPGYAGGRVDHPTYEQVCEHDTGHAEVLRIEFDPDIIPYSTLVEIFFGTHDPTQLNRQGDDIGEQYRSVIFYHDDEQKKIAEEAKKKVKDSRIYDNPIVTAIEPLTNFFEAEDYHKDYFTRNPDQSYCQAVISPKVSTFRQKYKKYLS